jgi:hypothetical protein
MQKRYDELRKLPKQEQERTHRNVLLVLDDVVGSIKKAEFDPRLAQLVMNRRHLVFNGTVSIMIVTQKYTLIPSRIRSNASWVILFQLNPVDFETAYKDVVVIAPYKWRALLEFAFGKGVGDNSKRAPTTREEIKHEEEMKEEEVETEEDTDKANEKRREMMKNKRFDNLGIWCE